MMDREYRRNLLLTVLRQNEKILETNCSIIKFLSTPIIQQSVVEINPSDYPWKQMFRKVKKNAD